MGTDNGIRCGSQAQLAGGLFHPTQNGWDVKCPTLVTFTSATFSAVNKQGWQVFLRPTHVPGTPKAAVHSKNGGNMFGSGSALES